MASKWKDPPNKVRILVVGDSGCGKTSLLTGINSKTGSCDINNVKITVGGRMHVGVRSS